MSTYLGVDPPELQFPFVLKKLISCSLTLTNYSTQNIAFKIQTTNPQKYFVRPNNGIIFPRMTCKVEVTMQAQEKMPTDIECKDKFLVQSILVNSSVTKEDITQDMLEIDRVEKCKLRVVYVFTSHIPSPVSQVLEKPALPLELQKNTSSFVQLSNKEPDEELKGDQVITETFISKILNTSERRNIAWFVFGITIGMLVVLLWSYIVVTTKMIIKKILDSVEDYILRALLFVMLPLLSKFVGVKVYEFINFVIVGGELKEDNSNSPQNKVVQ